MGKHPRDKKASGKTPTSKPHAVRPAPYPKKARVEVWFEGAAPNTSQPLVKSAPSRPDSSTVSNGKGKDKAKAKGKAKAPTTTFPESVLTNSPPSTPDTPAQTHGNSFMIIAGSYEKLLYGLEGTYSPGSDKPSLEPIFIFPAHLACVKAVAASPGGKWLATGSEDEFIKVWDLRRRKEVGSLSQHTGSITSVHFPTPSHLLATSEDSTMSLFRTSDWALLKSLKGHSGRVNHVDVHPTGRVALSVGKDKTLRMWDLMRGRGASSLPLGTEAEMVKFSPLGTHFAVLYPKKIEIYSLTLQLLHTMTTTARFNTLLFALIPTEADEEEVLCVGTEKGVVEVYVLDLSVVEEGQDEDGSASSASAAVVKMGTLVGHSNRIKSISVLPYTIPGSTPRPVILLASVSSDGLINLHDLSAIIALEGDDAADKIEPIASYDTKGSRLTVCHLAEGKRGVVTETRLDVSDGGDDDENDPYESAEQASDDEGIDVEIEREDV